MNKFIQLFHKVNGFLILKNYAKSKVLLYSLIMTLLLGIDKKSLEIVRLSVNNKLLKRLRKKYVYIQSDINSQENTSLDTNLQESRKVWVCWFQGIEHAPAIVQKCYESIKYYIKDREVILLTEENYSNYVTFPDYICDKVARNIISKTHLSDLLRLEILNRYGGTWIDATVYLTDELPRFMLDSPLFLFQNLKPGLDGHCISISSWFITAERRNPIINFVLMNLYSYWSKENYMLDYYLLHLYFQLAIEKYPKIWKKVVPYNNSTSHIILLRLNEQFDQLVWDSVVNQICIHKLSYKTICNSLQSETYLQHILENNYAEEIR